MESTAELSQLLEQWDSELNSGVNSLQTLKKIAELVERETEIYLKMDPDPFDERHPCRANPDCALGHVLKILLKNDDFINKLINNYLLSRDNRDLNTVAARLLLNVLPCLETSVVFHEREGLVDRLFQWAEYGTSPLQAYAAGLLAPAMEIPEIASNFREKNAHLVPVLLKRLKTLANVDSEKNKKFIRPFAHLNSESSDSNDVNEEALDNIKKLNNSNSNCNQPKQKKTKFHHPKTIVPVTSQGKGNRNPSFKHMNECSGSSWQEIEQFVIGSLQMYPLTNSMEQRLILQYLTPLGEYQELLSHVIEHNALQQILNYADLQKNPDVRLAFEALKYLASLLCHKKIAIEFINSGGLQNLLRVPRPSLAATGVSVCLYYLAYSEDAMEWVCLLPRYVLSELVQYVLWLLECSHESSRCHATMFFGLTFPFKILHELFDEQDGLRKLVNVVSTLQIFDDDILLSDDEVFAGRQQARHVMIALKKYYETHLAIMAEKLRRAHSCNQSSSPHTSPNLSKNFKYDSSLVSENIETVMELMPLRMRWKPVDELHKYNAVSLLVQVVGTAASWNFSGRAETVKSALDVLNVSTVMPRTQMVLTEPVTLGGQQVVAMATVLAAAEGEVVSDPEVMKSAVSVVINCVCGPVSKMGSVSQKSVTHSAKKKSSLKHEDLLSKMWNCVRVNNGIMVLLKLLEIKTPITDADYIRALACKALVGLVRSDTVRQVVGKLPLFVNGSLQVLMQEPVLQDKRLEHVKFCKFALKLLEVVTGKPLATQGIETSIDKIHKADVVAQTKIVYKDKDLLLLINQHLVNKGLLETANILMKEANLHKSTSSCSSWSSPLFCRTSCTSKLQSPNVSGLRTTQITPRRMALSSTSASSVNKFNSSPNISNNLSQGSPSSSNANGSIKINLAKIRHHSLADKVKVKASKTPSLQKGDVVRMNSTSSPCVRRQQSIFRNISSPVFNNSMNSISSNVTLDSIVTEYLRKQHALCRNPVVTCPPFDLFQAHRCPEPMFRNTAPYNIAARIQRRPIFPCYGGPDGLSLDRRHIYSRFRPAKLYRDSDQIDSFSCCVFSPCNQYIVLGTCTGHLKFYNVLTGAEEENYLCHETEITHCEPSKNGSLYLTSSQWRRPLSALWSKGSNLDMKLSFDNDSYMEFSKFNQDRIVGTAFEHANIYDVGTGNLITKLHDAKISNNYTKNRATFSPTDEFVLSDGILWDVHNAVPVHKFDKFNSHINGVFHPNALEIISNSEVWDIRTFHLLKTVPALDQCRLKFSYNGDVIYGAILEDDDEVDEDERKSQFGSSFRTFSAQDYSNIATIDIKKNIYDLCTNKYDNYLAIIENQGDRDGLSNSETACRLYEIGRLKDTDDDDMDDDEEETDEVDENSDDDDDDDDDDFINDGDDNADGNDDIDSDIFVETDEDQSSWFTDDDDDDDNIRFALAE